MQSRAEILENAFALNKTSTSKDQSKYFYKLVKLYLKNDMNPNEIVTLLIKKYKRK